MIQRVKNLENLYSKKQWRSFLPTCNEHSPSTGGNREVSTKSTLTYSMSNSISPEMSSKMWSKSTLTYVHSSLSNASSPRTSLTVLSPPPPWFIDDKKHNVARNVTSNNSLILLFIAILMITLTMMILTTWQTSLCSLSLNEQGPVFESKPG